MIQSEIDTPTNDSDNDIMIEMPKAKKQKTNNNIPMTPARNAFKHLQINSIKKDKADKAKRVKKQAQKSKPKRKYKISKDKQIQDINNRWAICLSVLFLSTFLNNLD